MSSATLQLTESALHEILNFVVSSRISDRKPLYESLRQLGRGVLNLDEMVVGQCGATKDAAGSDRCSRFNPVLSMSGTKKASSPLSPCGHSIQQASSCAGDASVGSIDGNDTSPRQRVVVCQQQKIRHASSLCVVSSTTARSPEDVSALIKMILPYLEEAFQRVGPEQQDMQQSTLTAEHGGKTASLTSREREVLNWTAKGKGCWETGLIVGISERTVKFHLQNIYRKLNVLNRAQAVATAAQHHLL